jgi:hypothetical protein
LTHELGGGDLELSISAGAGWPSRMPGAVRTDTDVIESSEPSDRERRDNTSSLGVPVLADRVEQLEAHPARATRCPMHP